MEVSVEEVDVRMVEAEVEDGSTTKTMCYTTKTKNSKKNHSKVIWWRCDTPGHYETICPEKQIKNQEKKLNEKQEVYALYVHEVVFLNEDKVIPKNLDTDKGYASVWYLDNGASNHMMGNKDLFLNSDHNTKENVKFGDGSCVYIIGKDVETLVCKSGEKKALKDIYYIPTWSITYWVLDKQQKTNVRLTWKTSI